MNWRKWLSWISTLSLLGCGGPAQVEGSVGGFRLEAKSALFSDPLVRRDSDPLLWLVISDVANYCQLRETHQEVGNATSLELALRRTDGQPFETGEYQVVDSSSAPRCLAGRSCPSAMVVAALRHADGQCAPQLSLDQGGAVSGTVTLRSVRSGQWVEGTFDLRMGQAQEHLSGSFGASSCQALLRWRPDRSDCTE